MFKYMLGKNVISIFLVIFFAFNIKRNYKLSTQQILILKCMYNVLLYLKNICRLFALSEMWRL